MEKFQLNTTNSSSSSKSHLTARTSPIRLQIQRNVPTKIDQARRNRDDRTFTALENILQRPKTGSKALGISFRGLNVRGTLGSNYLHTVTTAPLQVYDFIRTLAQTWKRRQEVILHHFDGLVRKGELLAVLGRPGSGCTTLLKVLAGQLGSLQLEDPHSINYEGAWVSDMCNEFRSECIYTAELDVHFPELTVSETLRFAADTRPSDLGTTEELRHVLANVLGLSEAATTKVGDDIIRGISGGEKKRLSIVEAVNGLATIQCWDNVTRGMDSATALIIIGLFKRIALLRKTTVLVSLYQASQRVLDLFDKVTVLYEGQQIFFGTWTQGQAYFESMGFRRPHKMTAGDFFTALTNPKEARSLVRDGYGNTVPSTAEDFAYLWHRSHERTQLIQEINAFDGACPPRDEVLQRLRKYRAAATGSEPSARSPYNINIRKQVMLCLRRGRQRIKNNIALPISTIIGNTVIGTIVGSVFYNITMGTDGINQRTILLFFVILLNAFMTGFEVLSVWAQRPIVEKHSKYALYHPFTEAVAAMLVDMPAKSFTSLFFNVVVYFMTNLRRSAAAFFTYLLFCFTILMTMSMFYRSVGSLSRTLQGSMVPIGIAIIFFIVYTGFVIPEHYMHPWFSWVRFLNPVAYAFEAVMINEFQGRKFTCSQYVPAGPSYNDIPSEQKICSGVGAVLGQPYIDGTSYLKDVFNYTPAHIWRNYGILVAMMSTFCVVHVVSSEYILAKKSKGEVLLFLRNHTPPLARIEDEEKKLARPKLSQYSNIHASTFCWDDLSYEIEQKGASKRLLTSLTGWVRPGTLTALMGATGAGKTTLLDVLSQRATTGIATGKVYLDQKQRGRDFQRKTGYVQQQDIHLPTATVREALEFSALLRRPNTVSKAEKLAYVNEVIHLLEMQAYAEAVVGVPGEGLNIEQRKRLTIGVELVAKPGLLLFLDEPTSGVDSQTAWTICQLLRKLADHGIAVLCTIHQPSPLLLEMFDKLLLIQRGGKTVYHGDVGHGCETCISYLEKNGAEPLADHESATEWMMEVTEPNSRIDWFETWELSTEKAHLKREIAKIIGESNDRSSHVSGQETDEYAVPFITQLRNLLKRTFVEYWRTPAFLWAKFLFSCGAAVAIAFSCWKSPTSLQGLQSQFFAIFTFFTTLSNLMQQIVAQFLERRALFEAREGPSKTFSWAAFITSAVIVEATYQCILAVCTFPIFYYPIGMDLGFDASGSVGSERALLMLILFLAFLLFTSTFSHLLTVGMEHRETIVNIGSLLFYLILIFCGVLVPYKALPKFWVFMYWMSPFTYLVRGMFVAAVARKTVLCSETEMLRLPLPRTVTTCGEYLASFARDAGGRIVNPDSTTTCHYCPFFDTDTLLAQFQIYYDDRWRSLGILFVFIGFNLLATYAVYWLVRASKKQKIARQ